MVQIKNLGYRQNKQILLNVCGWLRNSNAVQTNLKVVRIKNKKIGKVYVVSCLQEGSLYFHFITGI